LKEQEAELLEVRRRALGLRGESKGCWLLLVVGF